MLIVFNKKLIDNNQNLFTSYSLNNKLFSELSLIELILFIKIELLNNFHFLLMGGVQSLIFLFKKMIFILYFGRIKFWKIFFFIYLFENFYNFLIYLIINFFFYFNKKEDNSSFTFLVLIPFDNLIIFFNYFSSLISIDFY